MLDASLRRSFFSRTSQGRVIGMESSLGWHSEDKGVFMINQDFKQSDERKKELLEFELMVLQGESGLKENNKALFKEGAQLDFVMGNQHAEQMHVGGQMARNAQDDIFGAQNHTEGALDQESEWKKGKMSKK